MSVLQRVLAVGEQHNPLIPPVYDLVWTFVVGVLVVAVVALVVVLVVRSRQRRRTEPTAREQRLAELDELHARGAISDEEHRTARADALRA